MRYRRMFETRGQRPYYSLPHLGIFGPAFRKLVGFEYKKTIYTTSAYPDMHNAAYCDVAELERSSRFFVRYWRNRPRVRQLLRFVREGFRIATREEAWGWKQRWSSKKTDDLIRDARHFYGLVWRVLGTMFISQPQHVLPLDWRISKLLRGRAGAAAILRAATYFPGNDPWTKEVSTIRRLHRLWPRMSTTRRQKALDDLVRQFGWFNSIEGDKWFGRDHYREKVEHFEPTSDRQPKVRVPANIRQVGQLIGELGFLRFWNRYHFMHLRYHLKQILKELTKRSGQPDLEFATLPEVTDFFQGKKIDWQEVRRRKRGYVTILKRGEPTILTGKNAAPYFALVRENLVGISEITGTVANRGHARGRVRIVSFTAKDYDRQVHAFKQGEILVTGMTRPQIVHLCAKASAIVTDEGGITSHAAVVSRELNVPCVIATVNATKVFKTGDRVEVDAERGIVRRVNPSRS